MATPKETAEWAHVLEQTAANPHSQSETLMKQARDLKAESQRLRKLARETMQKKREDKGQ